MSGTDVTHPTAPKERKNAAHGASRGRCTERTQPRRGERNRAKLTNTAHRTRYPRIQILSIVELLAEKKIDYPRFAVDATFKKAPKARKAAEEQIPLGGEIEEPFCCSQ